MDGQGEVLVKLEGRLADQMKTIKEQSALLNAHIDVAQTAVSAHKKADNGSETDSGSRRTVKKR